MPPPDHTQARLAARALGVDLDDRDTDRLLAYLSLLQRWNTTYNLTAVRDPATMWAHHVLDCLAAVPSVRRHLQQTVPAGARPRILDVGSGGGLPGAVWAVALPEADIVCVDTVGKKAAFVRQAAGALGLTNLQARHARVEQLAEAPFDLITSRAFASLVDFTTLTQHALAVSGAWVAMKGKPPTDELAALGWPAERFHVEQLAVPGLNAERCLVWLTPAVDNEAQNRR
jgi:16S rRNA (guanine527-N7)-methyltransferase